VGTRRRIHKGPAPFRVSVAESIELLMPYTVDRICGCGPSEPYGMIVSTTQQGVIGFDLG
jgi:hypothetical protein